MPLDNPVDYSRYAYKSGFNNDLLGRALLYKQEKYDLNKEKLQGMYNQLSGIDLAKPEDRKYFDERLKTLNNEVTKLGMGDLSQPGVAEHVASFIGQAADDRVLNGYIGTIAGQNIKKQAQQTFQKTPEKYSQLNLDYSLNDYNNWLNDKTVGSVYRGGSNYIPYTDIVEKANKIIKELEPNAYVKFDPLKGSQFTMYKENGEVLSDSRIRAALEATIMQDPNVAQQMQINGWGEFRNMDDPTFTNFVRTSYKNQVNDYDKLINSLKRERLSAKGTKLQEIDNSINILNSNKKVYTDLIGAPDAKILLQKNNIAYQVYKDDFLNNMSNAFAYSKVKDIGFETYQEGLVKWKQEQEVLMEKEKQRSAKDDEMLKARVDALKLEATQGTEAAKRLLRDGYGFTEQEVGDLFASDIKWTTDETGLPNTTDSYKSKINNIALNNKQILQSQENSLLSLLADKNYFGLQNQFPKDPQEVKELENCLEGITKEGWDNMAKDGMVYGDYNDLKANLNQYKNAKVDYAIADQLRADVIEKVDEKVLETLNNGETYTTKDNQYNVRYNSNEGFYEVTPFVSGGLSFSMAGLIPKAGIVEGEPFIVMPNELKAIVGENLENVFPTIDTKDVYKQEYQNIYGDAATPLNFNVTSERDAVIARNILKQAGVQNFTNEEFKSKLEETGILKEGVIEQLFANEAKNTTKDEDKKLSTLKNIKFVTTEDGSYVEIEGIRQPLDPNMLTANYEGQQLLTAQQTIREEVKQLERQRYMVRHTTPGDITDDRINYVSDIPVKFDNGEIAHFSVDVVYQIHTGNDLPDNQVKPLLEIKDGEGNVVASKYISNNFSNLFDAKQLVQSLINSGIFQSETQKLLQQKVDEIEQQLQPN